MNYSSFYGELSCILIPMIPVQDCTEDLASYIATANFHAFKKLKLANQLAIGSYIHSQVMGL